MKANSTEELGEKATQILSEELDVDLVILPKYAVRGKLVDELLSYGDLFERLPLTDYFLQADISYNDLDELEKNLSLLEDNFFYSLKKSEKQEQKGTLRFVTFLHLRPFLRSFFRKNDQNIRWKTLGRQLNYRDTIARFIEQSQ